MSTTMLLIQDLDNAPDTDLLLSTSQGPQGCPGSPGQHAAQFSSSHIGRKMATHVPQGTLHQTTVNSTVYWGSRAGDLLFNI